MKARHRYLIARTSIFGCLLATALGRAIVVAGSAPSGQPGTLAVKSDSSAPQAFVALRDPAG